MLRIKCYLEERINKRGVKKIFMSTIGKEDQDKNMASSTEAITAIETKSAEIKEQYKKFIGRKILFILFSLILIFIIAGIAVTLGSYSLTVIEVYSIIWQGIPKIFQYADFITSHGFKEFFDTYFTTEEIVVWNLRLPRIIMGIFAGI